MIGVITLFMVLQVTFVVAARSTWAVGAVTRLGLISEDEAVERLRFSRNLVAFTIPLVVLVLVIFLTDG